MARRQLAGQHGQTLDATALVHEAYLKLIGRREAQVRRPRPLLRLRRLGDAQRGGRLRAPAPGAEARRRPAPRHRPARRRRRRPAPGRGHARPGHRADQAGRRRRAPGAGGGAALLRRPVRTGDRRAAASAPSAASAATGRRRGCSCWRRCKGLPEAGRQCGCTSAAWTPSAGNGCPRCSMRCSSSTTHARAQRLQRCARRTRQLADELEDADGAGASATRISSPNRWSRRWPACAPAPRSGRTGSNACSAKAAWARSGWPRAPTACTSAASR